MSHEAPKHHPTKDRYWEPKRTIRSDPSAGGYIALAVLAFQDYFHTVLSFCGVSDPEETELYHERSLIHPADSISVPLLLHQGLEDHVVPPEQARIIAENLERRGVPVELVEFEGEGHGFRRAE